MTNVRHCVWPWPFRWATRYRTHLCHSGVSKTQVFFLKELLCSLWNIHERSRKMNRLPCPRSGLLLKEGVDREVKAGQNFKHTLAQGPPGSLQLIRERKESRAKSKRSLARWYTSIIISRSAFFFSGQGWPTLHRLREFQHGLFAETSSASDRFKGPMCDFLEDLWTEMQYAMSCNKDLT